MAIGGGATGVSFCAASDFGRSANTDWIVGAGSGAGAAVDVLGGGEPVDCWATSGQHVATRMVPRAPANSRYRRTADERVMMLLPDDDVGSCWERGRPVAARPPVWTDGPARQCLIFHALNAIDFNGP